MLTCQPSNLPAWPTRSEELFRGQGRGCHGAAAWATSSILVFIDLEEQVAVPQRAEGTCPDGPRGRTRDLTEENHTEASLDPTEDRLLAELPD